MPYKDLKDFLNDKSYTHTLQQVIEGVEAPRYLPEDTLRILNKMTDKFFTWYDDGSHSFVTKYAPVGTYKTATMEKIKNVLNFIGSADIFDWEMNGKGDFRLSLNRTAALEFADSPYLTACYQETTIGSIQLQIEDIVEEQDSNDPHQQVDDNIRILERATGGLLFWNWDLDPQGNYAPDRFLLVSQELIQSNFLSEKKSPDDVVSVLNHVFESAAHPKPFKVDEESRVSILQEDLIAAIQNLGHELANGNSIREKRARGLPLKLSGMFNQSGPYKERKAFDMKYAMVQRV